MKREIVHFILKYLQLFYTISVCGAVIWSFGHLSKSKTDCQNRHYNINILFIYSEQ